MNYNTKIIYRIGIFTHRTEGAISTIKNMHVSITSKYLLYSANSIFWAVGTKESWLVFFYSLFMVFACIHIEIHRAKSTYCCFYVYLFKAGYLLSELLKGLLHKEDRVPHTHSHHWFPVVLHLGMVPSLLNKGISFNPECIVGALYIQWLLHIFFLWLRNFTITKKCWETKISLFLSHKIRA